MEEIITFLKTNPNPTEETLEDYASKAGLNINELREMIYSLLSTFIAGGKANQIGLTEEAVDPKQLAKGIQIEYEHVNPELPYAEIVAKRISLDHLAENPKYYTYLEEMEKKFNNNPEEQGQEEQPPEEQPPEEQGKQSNADSKPDEVNYNDAYNKDVKESLRSFISNLVEEKTKPEKEVSISELKSAQKKLQQKADSKPLSKQELLLLKDINSILYKK